MAWATVARADAPPDRDSPDAEVARKHFERGSQLYNQSNYEAAIVEFKAANDVQPHPDFDYNIARAYDRLGDWVHAVDYYQRYLAATPTAEDVRARVTELMPRVQKLLAAASPSPVPVVLAPPPPPPEKPWRLRIAAFVVGGLAVAAAGVGGGMYGWAAADEPSRRTYCRSLPRECVPSEWADLQARANAAYALWAVGGALVLTDVVLWVIDARHQRDYRSRLSVSAGGVGWRF